MQKAKSAVKSTRAGSMIQGRKVASAARGMTLVQVGRAVKAAVPQSDQAGVLVAKAARALKRPGIDRRVVFRSEGIVSYSVNPADPSQFIREAADGSQTLGYVVRGKFQEADPKAIKK